MDQDDLDYQAYLDDLDYQDYLDEQDALDAADAAAAAAPVEAPEEDLPVTLGNLGRGVVEAGQGIADKAGAAWDQLGSGIRQTANIVDENRIGFMQAKENLLQSGGDLIGANTDYTRDSLDILADEGARNIQRQAAVPDGIGKTIGGFAGEALSAAPLLGAGAPAGLLRATGAAALENGVFEGLTTQGDLKERGIAAATGAAFGGLAAPVVRGAGSLINKVRTGKAGRVVRADESIGNTPEGDARIAEAREVGIELDRVDAEGVGQTGRQDIIDSGNPEYATSRFNANEANIQAGRDNISPLGDVRGTSGSTQELSEDSADSVARIFEENRVADDKSVNDAYQLVSDTVGGDTAIPLPDLRPKVAQGIEDLLDLGETGSASGLTRLMDRLTPDGSPVSVRDIIKLRKASGRLHKQGNDEANRVIGILKNDLDEMMATLPGGGPVAAAFGDATATARANFAKYKRGSVAEKATRLSPDGNLAIPAKKQMDQLWKSNDTAQLRDRKAQMSEEGLVELERSANSKIMESLDAASKGSRFNGQQFSDTWAKTDKAFKEEMFGEEGAEALAKFSRSAALLDSAGTETGVAGSKAVMAQTTIYDNALDWLSNTKLNRYGTPRVVLGGMKGTLNAAKSVGNKARLADDVRRLKEGNLPAEAIRKIQEDKIAYMLAQNPALNANIELVQRLVQRWAASFSANTANGDRSSKLMSAKSKQGDET